ncbi:MAG: hypothetical protein HAW60_02845 [Bdellovibrionales bacterium]|nr:hypothetical protein [Bdellovibrionales bacterium]
MFTKIYYFFGLLFLSFLVSCGEAGVDGTGNGNGGGLGGGGSSSTKSAATFSQDLALTSRSALKDWLRTPGMQGIENEKMHLNLVYSGHKGANGLATYQGEFSVRYTAVNSDGRKQNIEYVFETGEEQKDTQYNYVYLDDDGSFTWKAFFQDEYGSILIILTQGKNKADECSKSDGCLEEVLFSIANGAVYYRNWPPRGQAELSDKKCWLLWGGPYDCRTWKSGRGINIKKTKWPDGTAANLSGNRSWCFDEFGKKQKPCNQYKYKRLGTFKDLDLKILFRIDPNVISSYKTSSKNLLAIKNSGKILTGVSSIVKNKNTRKLSSVNKNKITNLVPKILLVTLSIIFIGLLLIVFFKRKEKTQ